MVDVSISSRDQRMSMSVFVLFDSSSLRVSAVTLHPDNIPSSEAFTCPGTVHRCGVGLMMSHDVGG